ncbi:metabolite traffic protein EboE [Alienimonas californiensis]|uniref:Xylose isomerase-like TIM barrel n=1 Tax=Alienimonas californiensis TaxID=2527989 RepID=A0A517PDN0_9PLAN|nr:metabolite traffic protein EboE [Alienimonas californiensis]QDT17469.1 Xylose isomerase-like TIM barrel [Alienimonas californiensis]
MTLPSLPTCYCTNVHPGRSVAEVLDGLEQFAVPVRDRLAAAGAGPLAVGLWFAAPVAEVLTEDAGALARIAAFLRERDLTCYTLNAFPFGDFHRDAVKADVYLPDWTDPLRLAYTGRCAALLAALLPEGREGSVSTLPLGSALNGELPADFERRCIDHLLALARELDELHDRTGRVVRLAIEPEPFCVLETTAETIAFFDRLRTAADEAGCGAAARTHLGVCYDVCHQAVEFEAAAEVVAAFEAADVRINKVQLSCAVELPDPADADARAALVRYAEPRYLHQTFAAVRDGDSWAVRGRAADIAPEFADAAPPEFFAADAWRTHFHVPISRTDLGPLNTTRPELAAALSAVAGLPYAPHLEVETYTWPVLPGATPTPEEQIEGIAAELLAAAAIAATTVQNDGAA